MTEVQIDLLEGELEFQGRSVRLSRRLAKLADILASQMPNTVAHETVTTRMWGDKEIDVDGNLKVAVAHLRARLRPIGLDVVNNWGRGYRLTILPEMLQTERRETERASA